ncbi:hypothetical protein [Sorangium sp. So ce124]|uniref:hypothetical protein n=1 Tax=Sorangium sp. So ce124 TaxID=3133280 RepID=UPI003F60294C
MKKTRLATLAAKVEKLEKISARLQDDEIKPRLDKLEERVDLLENGHTMGPRTGGSAYRLYKLEKRVDSLEGLDPMEPEKIHSDDELLERIDTLEKRVDSLEKRAASKRELDARMGLSKPRGEIRREGNTVVFETMTPEDARKALAAPGRRGRQ